jgi:putative addiction module CopG family antidote
MPINPPLPPDLAQFVRVQLAKGRFQSEGEVIRAALYLLEEQSARHETSRTWRKTEIGNARPSITPEPGTTQFWDRLRKVLGAPPMPAQDAGAVPAARRSPRGVLADLRSGISPDEIKEARSEMWSGFPRGEA